MSEWLQDFRYGARMLVKRPGTSTIAIVALALGIGLTTTMFSIVHGAILRGLPFPEGTRILALSRARVDQPNSLTNVPVHDFVDWQARQRSFARLAGYSSESVLLTGDGGYAERQRMARVTPGLFDLLRVQPLVGRAFTDADAAPGAPAVAIISHRLWTARFAAAPDVIGREIRLDRTPTTIVGVMPERFAFPQTQDVWMPFAITLPARRGEGRQLSVVGRLADGVSESAAGAEMIGIARQLAGSYPENKDFTARVDPYVRRSVGPQVADTLMTMLAAVFGVMLIACVNVTNLQLARAAERTKEVAIRAALGSGRWRVIRQLLAEGLLLSAVGALLGVGIAQTGAVLFNRAIADTNPPFWIEATLDPKVLAFVTAISVAAALVSSLMPGWRVSRTDPNVVLRDDTRGATSIRMGRFSRWLVVAEVAVSCVLLVVSGLMVRSILVTSRFDFPFATKDVFVGAVQLDTGTSRDRAALGRAIEDLEARLRRVPGPRAVGLTSAFPVGFSGGSPIEVEGEIYASDRDHPLVLSLESTPSFFDVMGIGASEGRLHDASDRDGALPVAVLGEDAARRYFPGGSAIGRRFRFRGNEPQPWITVVGLVPPLANVRRSGERTEIAYLPMAQRPESSFNVVASVPGDPVAIGPAVRRTLAEMSPESTIGNITSLEGLFWQQGWPFRVFGGLFMTFGLAALVLAAAGLYGVMAFTVRRRTQELGVRMALGANRRKVLGLVLWQGAWRVGLGIAIGVWPAYLVAGQLTILLANVTPGDVVVYAVTVVTLFGAGLFACLAPALRAASVDPLTALRRD